MSKSRNALIAAGVTSALLAGIGFYQYYRLKRASALKRTVDHLMQVLNQEHVHIKDPAVLRGKLLSLLNDTNKIQVLIDFDYTISKSIVNGTRGATCHGVIEKSSIMPKAFREEIAALKNHYLPLEMSPDVSYEEKIPLMVECIAIGLFQISKKVDLQSPEAIECETCSLRMLRAKINPSRKRWYEKAHELMGSTQIKRQWIPDMVSEANIELRDGADEFFRILECNQVPVVIFSAGVGDILLETIKQKSALPSNAHVISNFMSFDDMGDFKGFQGELIHSFNKHDVSLHNRKYFDKLKSRNELIIIGDTLGDKAMADGIDYAETVLKIGFLNQDVEKSLSSYQNCFDIVIVEDQSLDVINVLFNELLKADI